MRVEEIRKITKQAELECSNNFWEEFKDKLFEGMKNQAECRCDHLTIKPKDKLSETKVGACWITYKPLREKVIQELKNLGYKVSYIDSQQSEYITIDWS